MKHTSLIIAFAAALLLAACENPADKTTNASVSEAVKVTASPAAEGVKYAFTPNSEIHFIGSKVTGSHNGGFKKFTGTFTVANNALAGTGQKIVIDMNSLWSDNEKLTDHLMSEDFFNVAKFPESSFELTGLQDGFRLQDFHNLYEVFTMCPKYGVAAAARPDVGEVQHEHAGGSRRSRWAGISFAARRGAAT